MNMKLQTQSTQIIEMQSLSPLCREAGGEVFSQDKEANGCPRHWARSPVFMDSPPPELLRVWGVPVLHSKEGRLGGEAVLLQAVRTLELTLALLKGQCGGRPEWPPGHTDLLVLCLYRGPRSLCDG